MDPTANHFGEIIDCRTLRFDASFYKLKKEDALELAVDFYDYIEKQFRQSSVLLWEINNRVLKNSTQILESGTKVLDIFLTGDVYSERVYHKTSLRDYNKKLENSPVFYMGLTLPFVSVDYPEYVETCLAPYDMQPKAFKKALCNLFSEENRINQRQFRGHDLSGMFLCAPNYSIGLAFAGKLRIDLSVACFKEELEEYSANMRKYACYLSEKYTNINITIGIDQSGGDYVRYLGSLKKTGIEERNYAEMNSKAKYLYLCNVGWFNVVSPSIIRALWNNETQAGQYVLEKNSEGDLNFRQEALSNGALCLGFDRSILGMSMDALKGLKRKLYPVLLPAEGLRGLKPICRKNGKFYSYRCNWENVPILDEEILVTEEKVEFQSLNVPDVDYLLT